MGAGPYGLSLAAHLREAGVNFRQFGYPMRWWRESMPAGLSLKSQGFASNLSDPYGRHTPGAFCRQAGYDYADYGYPVPLATFVAYGDWFADRSAPGLERTPVTGLRRSGRGYELDLATGERARARSGHTSPGSSRASCPATRPGTECPRGSPAGPRSTGSAGTPRSPCGHGSTTTTSRACLGLDLEILARTLGACLRGLAATGREGTR